MLSGLVIHFCSQHGKVPIDEFVVEKSGVVRRVTASPSTFGARVMGRGVEILPSRVPAAAQFALQFGVEFDPKRTFYMPSDGAAFLVAIASSYPQRVEQAVAVEFKEGQPQ